MTDDTFPQPVSDPEAEGLPGTADDDSTARDDVDTGRIADGPDPAALPLDRDDQPLAVDAYGTTPEEARLGEPLDLKLAREVPDPALELATDGGDDVPAPLTDELDEVDDLALDEASPDPNTGSQVSMYDTGVGGGPVGRLVEPDQGSTVDTEPDAIAYDAGAAGGGPSAEEAAMHEIPG